MENLRILIVDDNQSIHDDYRKTLAPIHGAVTGTDSAALNEAEEVLFGAARPASMPPFEVDCALQGEAALTMVQRAIAEGRPYSVAFVDGRMPPGVDGVQTIRRIWELDARVQAVLCTAYSDYTWEAMLQALGRSDRLLLLKKPFDASEVRQMALTLCTKWTLARQAEERQAGLEQQTHRLQAEIESRKAAEADAQRAREAAETANRSKSAFLANMSHEIRTPMTAILGYTDLLLEPNMPVSHVAECVSIIRRNGQHLLTLINDILDLSKIEAGKLEFECTTCSPFQIVEETISLMRVRAVEKKLSMSLSYGSSIPEWVLTDPTRVRQILVNLLGNAIKFTNHGSVDLTLHAQPSPEGPIELQFVVRDTGIGMESEVVEKLFQPFQQGESSSTRRFGGTGLGLSISKRLAQMMGGDIAVRSDPGRGSTFTVYVPVQPAEGTRMLECPSRQTVDAPAPLISGEPLQGVRILVAEDGADNQRLIRFLLKRAGAIVEMVENGRAAVEAAQSALQQGNPFAAILMDVQMPEMDGHTATATLRAGGYKLPIVALTAHAMEGDRRKCIAAGCDNYVSKPIDATKLVAALLQHCPLQSKPAAA